MSIFFTWLQSCRLLSCIAVFLLFKIWKKPTKNCLIFQSALTFYVLIQQAAKIKPNLKNSQVARFTIGRKTSCSKFWPRDIHWEQKRHQLAINKKGKISVFIVVFKFDMHFCYRRTMRLYQENFSCNNKTNYTRRQKCITHKNNRCQVFSISRNDQPLFVNECKV